MNRRSILLAILAVITIVTIVASPVFSYGSYSGNQQYGSCTCHGTTSSVTVTMQSSPSTSVALSTGQTVSVWVNVTGSIGGTVPLGALIASNQASSSSLPTENGWTILSDPSGTTTKYNYYKTDSYSGSRSFKWTLGAPTTAGSYPLHARILHAGGNEFTKSAGPLNFNVQVAAISPPTVHISSPTNGATVSGTMTVSVTVTPGSGQTIGYVNLKVDGVQVGNDTSSPYSFGVSTTSYSNGPHTLNVTAADTVGRKGYDQISVSVNNAPPANPTVVINSPTNGQTVVGTISVTATVTPGSGQTIAYVSMRIDGVQFANDTASPYSGSLDTTAYSDGQHSMDVTGADTGGRKGFQQIVIVINNTGGGTPVPIVTIVTPTNGATVSGVIFISATVTSTIQITHVILAIDGLSQGDRPTSPYEWNVDTNAFSNGQHTVNVTATDSNSEIGYMEIMVIVSNLPPTVAITYPIDGATVTGDVAVSLNVTNASAIGYVLLRIDGTDYSNISFPPYDWSVDTNLFADGHRLINATAADVYGRRAYAEVDVIVNNALSVMITAPVAGANYQGIVTVSATVAGGANISFAQLWVNGSLVSNITAEPYSWELNTADYGDGPMTINVTAKDNVGRYAYQEISIVIDNPGQDEPLDSFIATIIAGTIGLVALITASVIAVLFLKGKRPGGK